MVYQSDCHCLPYSVHFSEFMPTFFTRKQTKYRQTEIRQKYSKYTIFLLCKNGCRCKHRRAKHQYWESLLKVTSWWKPSISFTAEVTYCSTSLIPLDFVGQHDPTPTPPPAPSPSFARQHSDTLTLRQTKIPAETRSSIMYDHICIDMFSSHFIYTAAEKLKVKESWTLFEVQIILSYFW